MEWLTKLLFDFDKLPSKFVMIICFLTGILLFVPAQFLVRVKLNTFNDSYGQWVGIGFICSVAFLGVTFFTYVTTRRRTLKEEREKKKQREEYHAQLERDITANLQRLDPLEQAICREFFIDGSAVNLPMDNASVVGLQDKHIIRLAQSNLGGSYFMQGFDLPFLLTDFARSVIEKNPVIIEWPSGREMSEEQKQRLMDSRPPWKRRNYFGSY